MLVVGVSALIGLRGFDTARTLSDQQSIVIDGRAAKREAGTTGKPDTAVLGAAARGTSRRSPAARRRTARPVFRKASARGDLTAPARKRADRTPAAPQTSAAATTAAEKRPPAPEPAPVAPVDEVVDDVAASVDDVTSGTAETVGDVLLDLRDALP